MTFQKCAEVTFRKYQQAEKAEMSPFSYFEIENSNRDVGEIEVQNGKYFSSKRPFLSD